MNNNFKIEHLYSLGNYSINDFNLLIVKNSILIYPCQGYLILFNINNFKEILRKFICNSTIKIIKLYDLNSILIIDETSNIFLYNFEDDKIILNQKICNIFNCYDAFIENNYFVISHHSIILNKDLDLDYSTDFFSLFNIKNNKINLIFTKDKKQNNSNIIYNNKVFSFYLDNKINKCDIFDFNNNLLSEINLKEIENPIKLIKILKKDEILILTKKMKMFIFNLNLQTISKIFNFNQNCEIPNFYYFNNEIYFINYLTNLVKFNPDKYSNRENLINEYEIVSDNKNIELLNWNFVINDKYFIVIYSKGIYFINLKTNKIDFILENYLKQSATQNNIIDNFIYCGDLKGNIIKLNIQNKITKLFNIKEGIRAININQDKNTIYFATFKGNIFIIDNSNDNIKKFYFTQDFIDNYYKNNTENTITCLQIIYQKFLIFSNIYGYIFIFDISNGTFLYSFKAHHEQIENKDLNFGSLHLRSEIWTFKVYEKSILNNIKDDIGNFYLATGSEDQTVNIFDISYKNSKEFTNKLIKSMKNHKLAVTCIDIGKRLNTEILISCSDDKTINIYDILKDYELIYNYSFLNKIYGFFTLTYLSLDNYNENNNLLCIGCQNGFMIIFDIFTKEIKFLEKTHYGGIEGLTFKNNIIITSGNDNMINTFKIIN